MSTLLVHELITLLEQEIATPRDVKITAIRPYVLKHGNPSGAFKMQLLDTNKKLIKESAEITISTISASDYFHGVVLVDFNANLDENNNYWFRMVPSGGYSYTATDYLGWCNGYDLGVYSPDYAFSAGLQAALKIEIWEETLGRRT